jgi:hypothetical protein
MISLGTVATLYGVWHIDGANFSFSVMTVLLNRVPVGGTIPRLGGIRVNSAVFRGWTRRRSILSPLHTLISMDAGSALTT